MQFIEACLSKAQPEWDPVNVDLIGKLTLTLWQMQKSMLHSLEKTVHGLSLPQSLSLNKQLRGRPVILRRDAYLRGHASIKAASKEKALASTVASIRAATSIVEIPLGVRAVATGEFRAPRQGEWFLSGSYIEAYRAENDLMTAYNIEKLALV